MSCSATGVSHSLGKALSTKGSVSPIEASLFTHFGSCLPVRIYEEENTSSISLFIDSHKINFLAMAVYCIHSESSMCVIKYSYIYMVLK